MRELRFPCYITLANSSPRAGTYPRANKCSDGSLVGAYTAFSDGNNVITIVKSTDSGNTWTFQGTVATASSTAHDLDNPYLLELPNGQLVIAYRNHDKDASGTYTVFRITLSYSTDGGASWLYLSDADVEPGPVTGKALLLFPSPRSPLSP